MNPSAGPRRSLQEFSLFCISSHLESIEINMNEHFWQGKFKVVYPFETSALMKLWTKKIPVRSYVVQYFSIFQVSMEIDAWIPSNHGASSMVHGTQSRCPWYMAPNHDAHGAWHPITMPMVNVSSLNTGKYWTEKKYLLVLF